MTVKQISVELDQLWTLLNRSSPFFREILGGLDDVQRQEMIDLYSSVRDVYFSEQRIKLWSDPDYFVSKSRKIDPHHDFVWGSKPHDETHCVSSLANLSKDYFKEEVEWWQDYECEDLLDLITNIKNHGKKLNNMTLVPFDEPKQLKIGFLCLETLCCWKIRIGKLKQSLNELKNKELSEKLKESFSTREGKHQLCDVFREII